MKKIKLSLLLMIIFISSVSAQMNLEGVADYGRLLDLSYHPTVQNKIYAVTLKSHIVTSNDNGDTWEFFYSFPDSDARIIQFEVLDNSTLSFAITNTGNPLNNTLYFMDIDTAVITKQFTPPVTPNANYEWTKSYDVYEADTDVVILNNSFKVGQLSTDIVYYTTDGGSTWANIYVEDMATNFEIAVNEVAIHPSNPSHIYIARSVGPTDNDGGLLISTDGGNTYIEKLAGFELNAMTFSPTNSDIMYLGSGWGGPTTLYKSLNAGEDWSIVPITWDETGVLRQVNYIEINPYDNDDILILAGDEMSISTDGGLNWANYAYDIDATSTLYVYGVKASYNPYNSDQVLISTDRYPTISNNDGATLEKLFTPFYNSNFIAYNPIGDGHLYYGVQSGIIHRNMTTDVTQDNQIVDLGTYSVNSKNYFPDEYVEGRVFFRLGSGVSGSLYRVENHGEAISGILRSNFGGNIIDVETNPSNTDEVWISFNSTETFVFNAAENLSSTPIVLPVVNLPSPAPQIYHFSTWIDPLDGNHVWIGQGGRIYESFDKGVTWAALGSGFDLFLDADWDIIYDIQQSPFNANEFVASTSQGIFKSSNSGAMWTKVADGTYIRKIDYSNVDPNVIIASVYSSLSTNAHLMYSTDNGTTWTIIPNSTLEYVASNSMAYSFESGLINVYIATSDCGPATYTIDVSTLSSGEDLVLDNGLHIYPNPANNFVKIKIKEGQTIDNVAIFNLNGQRVLSTSYVEELNVSSLQSGIYLLRAGDSNGNYYIKKLVIK